jgi:hypothetical protein
MFLKYERCTRYDLLGNCEDYKFPALFHRKLHYFLRLRK